MGSYISRRRRTMDDDSGESTTRRESSGEEGEADLATILSYLIRSGQVRVMSSGGEASGVSRWMMDDENDETDEDEVNHDSEPAPKGIPDPNPDTSSLETSALHQELLLSTAQCNPGKSMLPHLLHKREVGMLHQQKFTPAQCCKINADYLPNSMDTVARLRQKAFCGTYSKEGDIFLSACQDRCLRIYDTRFGKFQEIKCIQARDVGWSVLDTAFSPDGNYLVYSSWSDCLNLCNVHGSHEVHQPLPLQPQMQHSFSIFSLQFSSDNEEILGGANDGYLYIYDRQRNERTLRVECHEDDVNAVCFADTTSQILFSGGDDGLVKVWDRRSLSEADPKPVGVLAGHMDGITFIDTRGDARYLISNSKDQSIKLWDMRKFSTKEAQDATRKTVAGTHWDYRWQSVPRKVKGPRRRLWGDSSLMTYCGHTVQHTLIRARFSPRSSTGGRYIYTGCASGAVVIYDVMSGEIVKNLCGQRACVRDVSWHPYESRIITSSWDGTVGLWSYQNAQQEEDEWDDAGSDDATSDDGDEDSGTRRRCTRRKRRKTASMRAEALNRRSLPACVEGYSGGVTDDH